MSNAETEAGEEFNPDDLEIHTQALFITSAYPRMQVTEKFVLLVTSLYSGAPMSLISELCGVGFPTVRTHLRFWAKLGAVELSGTSKDATATFLGGRHWQDFDRESADG